MNTQLLDTIETLAGVQRGKTFRAAAEFILSKSCHRIVETGCFRGITGDGQSTLIFAMLANELGGRFDTIDLNPDHIAKARDFLASSGVDLNRVGFQNSDSVTLLSSLPIGSVCFAYLDSFDHDPGNPGPCQRHELAEIGAILGKMATPSGILLDDCIPETGGKTLLGSKFLEERGWRLAASGYQLLYVRE